MNEEGTDTTHQNYLIELH